LQYMSFQLQYVLQQRLARSGRGPGKGREGIKPRRGKGGCASSICRPGYTRGQPKSSALFSEGERTVRNGKRSGVIMQFMLRCRQMPAQQCIARSGRGRGKSRKSKKARRGAGGGGSGCGRSGYSRGQAKSSSL